MAYVEPTAETFKARYPEFSSVPDALVTLVLADAIADVGETWVERDRARAQMLLCAHMLTLEGWPARATGEGGGGASSGPVKREKVGDVEVEYAGVSGSTGLGAYGGSFASSIYGQQYWELLKRNFPSPRVY